MNQRLLPNAIDTERAVLGSIFIDGDALSRVSDGLMTEDFYDQRHRWIYEAMLALRDAGTPIDLLTVSDQLEDAGHLDEVGGPAYLTSLTNEVPTSINAEHYAQIVQGKAIQRELIAASTKIAEGAYNDGKDGPENLLHLSQQLIAEVAQRYKPVQASYSTWADLDEVLGPIEWDWPGWLPKGFLIEIVGEQGFGKSILALRIASCFLRGDPWPDGTTFEGEVGKVLWAEAEASQKLNLDRAKPWGLTLENIVHPLTDPLEDVQLNSSRHQAAIKALAQRSDIHLVIIDSLSGGHQVDEQAASRMIPIIKWIAELARNTGKPIILTHHLRKRGLLDSTDQVTLDRVRGSSGITQLARMVWAVDTPDLKNPDARRLSVIKSNLARKPEPLGFTVVEDARLVFCDAPEPPRNQSRLDEAIEFLQEALADGPVASNQLRELAEETGISEPTLKRAKNKLGVKAEKNEDGWYWVPQVEEAA